jgi:hypothetical protein
VRRVRRVVDTIADIAARLETLQVAVGRIESRQTAALEAADFAGAEFKVFSQWGEDGIIQHLASRVALGRKIFVEFGVQDYREANTRFLLAGGGWSGLVIDADPRNIDALRRDPIYWRHNLKAECAFIDRDNINSIIRSAGIEGDIGLLSIDIDGNDYWVLEAIDCVSARILVLEYNALFGPDLSVTVPYAADFQRTKAHFSNLFWGASLAALTAAARRKGYALVGCNRAGNNAFFVRRDVQGALRESTVAEAFVAAGFRESRDALGEPTHLDVAASRDLVGACPVVDILTGEELTLREALARLPAAGG